MSNIKECLKFFQVPSFFRDILILMMGFNFLFLLNYLYKPSLSSDIPNYRGFGDATKTIAIIFFSYTIGRILVIVARVWKKFIYFIFKKGKKGHFKKKWIEFLKFVNPKEVKISNNPYKIGLETENFVHNTNLGERKERLVYEGLFSHLLLGFFLLIVFINFIFLFFKGIVIFLFFIFILTFISIGQDKKMVDFNLEIARELCKEKYKESK